MRMLGKLMLSLGQFDKPVRQCELHDCMVCAYVSLCGECHDFILV